MSSPTYGELFAGIGGFGCGLDAAGWRPAWQVEQDAFALKVLEKHWPEVPRYTDVRSVGAASLSVVDLVTGGFPCQDISQAGRKAGLAGARSGLWWEMARILEEVRPRLVLIENNYHRWRSWVPVVRRELWRLGYPSLPLRLRASDFGAIHERARCFLVADRDGIAVRLESWRRGGPNGQGASVARGDGEGGALADVDGVLCDTGTSGAGTQRAGRTIAQRSAFADAGIEQGDEHNHETTTVGDSERARETSSRRGVAPDADGRRQQPEWRIADQRGRARDSGGWATEPDVARVVHGLPGRVDGRRRRAREAALGNAVCPPIARWIGERLRAVIEEGGR